MLGNWIKQSVSAGGTGNLTVGSVTGFDTFDSQFGDATTNTPAQYFRYVVVDGNNYETGVGHMSAAATLVRDMIEMTLASGTMTRFPAAGLTVSTSAFVFCDRAEGYGIVPYVFNANSATAGVGPVVPGFGSGNTIASAANKITAYSFSLPISGVYTGVTWHATNIGTATTMILGIYDTGVTGMPVDLLAATASITTGGGTLATGDHNTSFSANVYLRAKTTYWYAVISDAAVTFNSYSNVIALGSGGSTYFTSTGQPQNGIISPTQTGWSSLATPFPSSPTTQANSMPLFTLTRSV